MGYGKYEGMFCSVSGCGSPARINGRCKRCYDNNCDVYRSRRKYVMKNRLPQVRS